MENQVSVVPDAPARRDGYQFVIGGDDTAPFAPSQVHIQNIFDFYFIYSFSSYFVDTLHFLARVNKFL